MIAPRQKHSEASCDLVYSSLAFHYIEDFQRLARMMHAALRPGGSLVFSIEHPVFMAAAHPHWISDEDGRKTWPVNRYAIEGERRTNWFANGVRKFHRTIGTTVNTLTEAGFHIRRIEEFAPTPKQIEENAGLAEELERPMLLLISAAK